MPTRRTTRRYKAAVLGLGAMGRRHLRILGALHGRFEVVGGYDVRGDVPPTPGVERFASEAEALAKAEVVIIASPIAAHAQGVARALAAGRHVLVEKPVCATGAEARAATSASRGGARLFVGHSERFNPVVRALARLIRDDGAVSIDLLRVGPSKPCGCGALVNLGVHDFDLAAYLGGGGVVLRGAVGGSLTPDAGEDFARVHFSTGGGATGHLTVDRTASTRERAIELSTRRWVYHGDLLVHRLTRAPRGGRAPSDVPLLLDEPLMAQAIALADALDGGSAYDIATGADGIAAVQLAEEAAAQCVAATGAAPLAENLSADARR